MSQEPIAIIGLSCRFSQAKNTQEFYQLLNYGVDAITQSSRNSSDSSFSISGGFLDNVDQFATDFFKIPPQEAAMIDPQHRLLLETAWEALEDAGLVPKKLAGSRTGVFVGIGSNHYSRLINDQGIERFDVTTGNQRGMAANRISYFFDFRGVSMSVDTACSSALVAVDRACRSLWTGESTLALVGGVNLILVENGTGKFEEAGLIARDNRCKVFDARADGYVRSEGVGMVVLKPLAQAQADRDRIYAIIKGSCVNQDGRSNGLTAPNLQAQVDLLQQAYQQAQVDPTTVTYIETHATGTPIGDALELKAISKVLGNQRSLDNPCRVGSVKTNIGHTEAVSGMAGLIKVILSLQHRQLFPTLHFQQPHPAINFETLRLQVQQHLESLPPTTKPLLMGVSAFGFGGTNAHVVLEEAPSPPPIYPVTTPFHLLTLSAQTETALHTLVKGYLVWLSQNPDVDLGNLCYSANTARSNFSYRLFTIVASINQLQDNLEQFIQDRNTPVVLTGTVNKRQRKIDTLSVIQESLAITESQDIFTVARKNRLLWQEMLTKLGCLWLEGHKVDWNLIYRAESYQLTSLPSYPFEKQRYWFESTVKASSPLDIKPIASQLSINTDTLSASENATLFQLRQIWQNLLNNKTVRAEDNFFELGGNSFLAANLCLEIENIFGQKIYPITIFEFPTLGGLAQVLQQSPLQNSSSLTIIQPQGKREISPLISINSMGQMRNLAANLWEKYPLVNLNLFRFSQEMIQKISLLEPQDKLPAIAETMVQDLCQSTLKPPYQFICFCGDAHLTLEVVRQLRKLNQDVAFIILIDGILRSYKPQLSHRYEVVRLLGVNYLFAKSKNLFKKHILRKFSSFSQQNSSQIQQKSKFGEFYSDYLVSRKQYIVQPYPEQTYLLLSLEWQNADLSRLKQAAGENLEIYQVPGPHHHLFDQPYINDLAKPINEILKASTLPIESS
ncbi:beta-ketoacyl synthase N-terminal-like domain-containing protein [Coleofasciculus sp. F4-SAH-05]|uniref:beta-ketoacyl synthase N-terminal-like domain-containing protein n=1 Tax=Coleofasciculus sp. F4-SAH-05 TaxID=3069525 RepID=UPI0032F2CE69